MELIRVSSMDDLPALDPHIEIRRTHDGRFNVGLVLNDAKSRLVGLFDTAETAEREGIAAAEREGIQTLHVAMLAD